MMDKYIGKKLDGRYEITELIGIGGMADVYKAVDLMEDNKVVAVKILKSEFADNDDFVRRFRNESKAIAVLSHPNIVKIYDVGFSDKIQFIVMEYIDGITLKEFMEQQGVLKWKDTVHFIIQILRALQHAHDRGIVHRGKDHLRQGDRQRSLHQPRAGKGRYHRRKERYLLRRRYDVRDAHRCEAL